MILSKDNEINPTELTKVIIEYLQVTDTFQHANVISFPPYVYEYSLRGDTLPSHTVQGGTVVHM